MFASAMQKKKTAEGAESFHGLKYEYKRNYNTQADAEINYERLEQALYLLGHGVVCEFRSCGFDERTAWQASMAAVNAATDRLQEVADDLIGARR